MEITAKLKYLRVTARKAREVVDLIRGKKSGDAKSLLSFTVRKSAVPVLKLLNSAIASAKKDFQMDEENLFVSKATVDEGPTIKRWHAMSRGRAYPIMKRSSHITIVLSEINPKQKVRSEIKKPKTTEEKGAGFKKTRKQTRSKVNKKITAKKKK